MLVCKKFYLFSPKLFYFVLLIGYSSIILRRKEASMIPIDLDSFLIEAALIAIAVVMLAVLKAYKK